jgi:hypothetical protein
MDVGFQFELLWNDEDVLHVRIGASNGEFGGTANVYVPIGGLAEGAVKLKGFPRSASDERVLEFGKFGSAMAGGAVSMKFYCKGAGARAFVETTIESDHDGQGAAETARFSVAVEASAIDVFVSELQRVEAARRGAAHLNVLVAA